MTWTTTNIGTDSR